MFALPHNQKHNKFLEFGLRSIVFILVASLVFFPSITYAQQATVLGLPRPGTMVSLSPSYVPVIVKGLHIHPENPILFDFIVDSGDSGLGVSNPRLRSESEKIIKYFLASLTIPEQDLWVNLSPYEKDRIIPEQLGQTIMGRDLLAQDYILKQLTASMINPEKDLGKEFWSKVYTKAQDLFGTSEIPVNTFNKVWIVADKAKVYVQNNTAFVVACHMKVMLEQDYLAMYKHEQAGVTKSANAIGSQVVREVVLPELEKEVNQGKNFSNLRQIFNSMILAAWYKKSLKEALLNQVYSNKAKINGIDVQDQTIKEKIYQEYLRAYKKGVFNYIKEDVQADGQTIPRKYFSGGIVGNTLEAVEEQVGPGDPNTREAMRENQVDGVEGKLFNESVTVTEPPVVQPAPYEDDGENANRAMASEGDFKLGLALLSSYVKENKNVTISKPIQLTQLGGVGKIIRDEIGLTPQDQVKFKDAIHNAVQWHNGRNSGQGEGTAPEIEVTGVVIIDRAKDIDPYEGIKLDKIREEMGGFYFQDGTLYVLKSSLSEAFKIIKNMDILTSQIVMAFLKDPIDLEDEEQLLKYGQDELYRARLAKFKEDSDSYEKDKQAIIEELKQRRHTKYMVKAYEYSIDYLISMGDGKISQDAKRDRRQLQVEKARIMHRLPGTYLKGEKGKEKEERAEFQRQMEDLGLGHIQLLGQNADRNDQKIFHELTAEVDTFLSYCGYQRALYIMAGKVDPENKMNMDPNNIEQNPGKGKRKSMVVWGSALNPLHIAHLLIALEQMKQADSGYLLLTEGDFRKLALLHSAPVRREMVTALGNDLFRGNQLTTLGSVLEPEAKTEEEKKYHPNSEEKVMGIARLNPNSDIHYGFGIDHYKAIIRWDELNEDNVRDFVYYMSMSDYVPLLKKIKEWYLNGTLKGKLHKEMDNVINLLEQIATENGLQGMGFEERRKVILNILLEKIKNKEIIHVPVLDSIPKLVLINKELESEGIPTEVRAVIALRGGLPIPGDPLRDKIIKEYKLKVTINDGITSEVSSTDIRRAIIEYVLTGGIDPYKLGAVPISEWQFLFGEDFKEYQNFLLRFEKPILPAIPKLLAERRKAKEAMEKAPESIALQKVLNAAAIRSDYDFEVESPDPPTLDRHTSFDIIRKVKGMKGPVIRVNYSVECTLDRVTGNDVTVFNTFSITFLSDGFSDQQKKEIENLIFKQIRGANNITSGTVREETFIDKPDKKEFIAAVIGQLIEKKVVARISDKVVRINEAGVDSEEGLDPKRGAVQEILETLMGDAEQKDKKDEFDRIWGILKKADNMFHPTVIDANAAMAAPVTKDASHVEGGIDLNSRNLQMDIDGETIDLKFDQAMVAQFQRGDFSGVMPIIIQISPIQDPLSMSLINPGKEEESLAKV